MENFLDFYKNKTVGFVGAGISNIPILKLFLKNGIKVTLRDKKSVCDIADGKKLNESGVLMITGENYLENIEEDILFLSPVLRPDLPQFITAKKNGTLLTTELEEFLKHCPCKTVGITGSDGKTTTSTLCAKLLEASGKRVFLGGNIGENLFVKLGEIEKEDFAVIEISSFQLMKMSNKPDIAIITNVSPNHLDWHCDMDEYTYAKKRIISKSQERTVLNGDDLITKGFECENAIYFGTKSEYEFSYREDGIYHQNKLILKDEDILVVGIHNRANYSAAIAAIYPYITLEAVEKVAKTFGGVEHRIELVRVINGVSYYNSSIDSSPTRTSAALNSFKEKVIVIAGGYDKNIPLDSLGPLFESKAKAVILMGDTAPAIEKILLKNNYSGKIIRVKSMKEAVYHSSQIATSGDKVILSPSAASFDLYPNFVCRGNDFKNEVNLLK